MGIGKASGQSAQQAGAAPSVRFLPLGDTGLTVEFGTAIDPALNAAVRSLDAALHAAPPPGLIETVPTFRSLLVHYNPLATSQADLTRAIETLLHRPGLASAPSRRWRLPVCYDTEFALDADAVAAATGLTVEEVQRLHATTEFTIYMLGFLPGFPFLGGLPKVLELPRRTEPRVRVPAGSVAIAMSLSCIYTVVSPGGWNILGRSPVRLFDPQRPQPALVAPGDQVGFAAVDRAEYDRLAAAIERHSLDPIAEFLVP
jgi:KipI family sensor histidine kinase inhibitor